MSHMQYDKATLQRAEERRQKILDLLNASPGLDYPGIQQHMPEYHPTSMRGAIANMLAKREIAAVGPKRGHIYFALVETTHSAASIIDAKRARNKIGNARRDPKTINEARDRPEIAIEKRAKRECERERKRIAEAKRQQRKRDKELAAQPWRTVHIVKADDPPLKNQGGQGALRRNVFINCEQNY